MSQLPSSAARPARAVGGDGDDNNHNNHNNHNNNNNNNNNNDSAVVSVVILGAGYGTRLQRDLDAEPETSEYAALRGLPKPLVRVGGRAIVDHWLDEFDECRRQQHAVAQQQRTQQQTSADADADVDVDADVCAGAVRPPPRLGNVYIVTNATSHARYVEWARARGFDETALVCDGTRSNDERLGAVADIELVVRERGLDGAALLVVAGDTLFTPSFRVADALRRFGELDAATSLVLTYELPPGDAPSKRGILELDATTQRVVSFLEKPSAEQTSSRMAAPPFYIYAREHVALLARFVHAETASRNERDAPGLFVRWLHSRASVVAMRVDGRFDIGNLADLRVADAFFSPQNANA